MDATHLAISLRNNHWSQRHQANAVVHPVTGKEVEWVYIEVRKGMYGLKQAGLLANQLLQTHLAPFGYYPARHTPGLCLHKTGPISFTLVVYDFAVKYVGKQHAEHLWNTLLRTYELKTDWTATVYSGMTFKWDYDKRTCDISMPGYVSNVLSTFQHDPPKHPQHTPSRYVTPVYGANTQYATKDDTPPLTAQQCITIQKVTRSVLYYARAVDLTVLMQLNEISTEQTKATENAGRHESNVGLPRNPPGRNNLIPRLRHGLAHPHICFLPLSLQRMEPPRRSVFFWGTNYPSKKNLAGPSLMSPPSSKTFWPTRQNQKLARAFTTPKVAPRSESHSPSWVTHNPQRLYEQITPLHSALRTKHKTDTLKRNGYAMPLADRQSPPKTI
jgi:hypothetical protein